MKFNWSWQETVMFVAALAAGVALLALHIVSWKELTGFAAGVLAFSRPVGKADPKAEVVP